MLQRRTSLVPQIGFTSASRRTARAFIEDQLGCWPFVRNKAGTTLTGRRSDGHCSHVQQSRPGLENRDGDYAADR